MRRVLFMVSLLVALLLGLSFAPPGFAADCGGIQSQCMDRCTGKSSDSRMLSLSGSSRFECEEACKDAGRYCQRGDQRAACKSACKGTCANGDRAEWGRCENACQSRC